MRESDWSSDVCSSDLIPIAARVQNLLIGDFLNYLALRHQIFLSSLSDHEKKKAQEQAIANSGLIDPLAELDIDVQSFDIPRMVSVFPDKSGIRWWTKAWFNGSEKGEAAIEIERELAIKFINENIEKDEWLEEYFVSNTVKLYAKQRRLMAMVTRV